MLFVERKQQKQKHILTGAKINSKRAVTGAISEEKLYPFTQRLRLIVLAIPVVVLAMFLAATASGAGVIMRASTDAAGNQGNAASQDASVSADGRYVAFDSNASNLVYGDTNGTTDVFVKDTQTGAISRASTNSSGGQVPGNSTHPSISADGRYVAFTSSACSLAAGYCYRNTTNIYIKDMKTGAVSRVSADTSGNPGNGSSVWPAISPDGRYVAFDSTASNLVPGDTNYTTDVFVKDTWTGAISRASTDAGGNQGNNYSQYPSISADGRYVAFESFATNLVPGDTNNNADIFIKDMWTGAISLASADASGNQGNQWSYNPSISADGRYLAFESAATNLTPGDTNGNIDVFVKDMWTGMIWRASTDAAGNQANDWSYNPSISADGGNVTFYSGASNLVPNDTNAASDIFIKNYQSGAISRASTDSSGNQANGGSEYPSISANSSFVGFDSVATNLAPGDANGAADVFLATGSGASCPGGKPALALSEARAYWASLTDYNAGNLSVDYEVADSGSIPAYVVEITSSTANNGVASLASMPLPLGNIIAGDSHPFTVKYTVPAGVTAFRTSMAASAEDGCSTTYNYP